MRTIFIYIPNNVNVLFVFDSIIAIGLLLRKFFDLPILAARAFLFSVLFAGLFVSFMFVIGRGAVLYMKYYTTAFWYAVNGLISVLRLFLHFFSFLKISVLKEYFVVKSEASTRFHRNF